jgi:hypothetical protein
MITSILVIIIVCNVVVISGLGVALYFIVDKMREESKQLKEEVQEVFVKLDEDFDELDTRIELLLDNIKNFSVDKEKVDKR